MHPSPRATLFGLIASLTLTQLAVAAGPEQLAAERRDGIWKSAIPPGGMKGEFDNHDPIGLAAGAAIKVDCSLNWVDPDDGHIYCFNSATAVEYFRSWPKANIRRARAAWEARQPTQ